ncbi:hypothetical protein BY458DRAFT_513660 [Sporodiniella umbellata]|nr:hypothetical protein BY458DRAFT_513660 [Sporodiniella umbellata]
MTNYERALKLHQEGRLKEAKEKYEELIDHKILKKEEKNMKDPKKEKEDEGSPLRTLFFVVSKNYASVLEEEYTKTQDVDSAKEAIRFYLQALEIDPTASFIWYPIGCLSRHLKNDRFAKYAFENGIFLNRREKRNVLETLSCTHFAPTQWRCFEGLCSVLYDIGDYSTCLDYIENILKNYPAWQLGCQLKKDMTSKNWMETEDQHQTADTDPIVISIEKADISLLIDKLLTLYKKQHAVSNAEEEIELESLESNINVSNTLFIHNTVKIDIVKKEDPQNVQPLPLLTTTESPIVIIDSLNGELIKTVPETTSVENTPETHTLTSEKRKREEGVESAALGEEEESDSEDAKKTNLRASRRKKEKFLNTEASRLKMIEEEKQFNEKIQTFYDHSLKDIQSLYQKPWHQPQHGSLNISPHFWDWFDIKMGELESTYSWDMDGKGADIGSQGNKGKGLTMFALNYACNSKSDIKPNSFIKHMIAHLNTGNSGAMDILCQLAMMIIKQDMYCEGEETSVMSNTMLDLLTEAILSLETNFTQYLFLLNSSERTLATLRVCEFFLDRLIRTIMTVTQESSSGFSASYKKKGNLLSKQSKGKQIESLLEITKFWSNLVEKCLLDLSLDWFDRNAKAKNIGKTLSQDEQKLELRFWMIQGKLAQCQDDIQSAISCYEKCADLLKLNPLLKRINVKSMYDAFIDTRSIEARLSLLQGGNLLVQAKDKSDCGDFSAVIDTIKPMVDSKLNANEPIESDETIQMLVLLAKGYMHSKQHGKAYECYRQIFCSVLKQLVEYGSNQFQSKSIMCKDEDVLFFKMGKCIGDMMDDLLKLIQDESSDEWLPKEIDTELIDVLKTIMKMTLYYVFRHPDFVPLVNNFSSPDSVPHTPSKITKSNRFNAIAVKSWVMFSILMKRELVLCGQGGNSKLFDWTKLLQELHDELGEREICCTSNDVFLHHLLLNLFETDSTLFRKDIYQCYHCIYGVHLGAETDLIEEHYCTHHKLDETAAEKLFELVDTAVIKKLNSGVLLKGDLKDVIDTVSEYFEQIPSSQKHVIDANKTVIENYLDSDLELSSNSTDSICRKALIPTVPIDAQKHKISHVFYKIFWIRGKTHRLQIRNRPKISTDKNMSDLESAIEEFTSHLVLNPNDGPSWYDLGACYHQLADEELHWSATNILSYKKLISEYQKKACHSIFRAIYLGGIPKSGSRRGEVFTQFGNLLYSMATPPMNMLAFESDAVDSFIGSDGNLQTTKRKRNEAGPVYKRCVAMYVHALRYNSSTESMWRCYYGAGKCYAKMRRPPTEILDWYMKAIEESKKENPKDFLVEPVYILCAALVKYLFKGEISASTVMEYLSKERALSQTLSVEGPHAGDDDLIQTGREHLPPDVAIAYEYIFKRLLDLVISDTKGWQHRPVYRLAWMHYYIFLNAERAKAELMKLFMLKSTIKNHINIWKPGFELPGKHYVYIQKYTMFFIKLAKETQDTNILEHLGRKLRKGQSLLLNHDTLISELSVPDNSIP